MRFVFGYAGIPIEVFNDIQKKEKSLTSGGENTRAIFAPPLKPFAPILSQNHIASLQEKFKQITLEEKQSLNSGDSISDIGFAVIYIRTNQETDAKFEEAFFPSTFVLSIDWKLIGRKSNETNESKNKLFQLLFQATTCARLAIKWLYKEITECRNRTPLLLPIKNFHSTILCSQLKKLQTDLANCADKAKAITEAIDLIKSSHPLTKLAHSKKQQPCFLDGRKIEFHSPGTALHGLPRPTNEHPIACLLGGYRRLGAPFHVAFHYDCMKGGSGKLKDFFYSCHEEARTIEGDPHLNIAPNDFVR